jgi:hypothetical protein
VLVTDKLKSYAAAKREIMPGVEHRLSWCVTVTRIFPHLPELVFFAEEGAAIIGACSHQP